MTDRNVQFPNRYRLVPVEGTTDIVDLIPAPGNVEDEGTLLNKTNLLSDETAVLYGKNDTAVPDDILAAIPDKISSDICTILRIRFIAASKGYSK